MTKPSVILIEGKFSRVWDLWLQSVRDTLFGHGADLIDQLGKAGITDSVAGAERALRWAVETKILDRGKNQPTPAQRFFDVTGDNARQGWVTSGYTPAGHRYAHNRGEGS